MAHIIALIATVIAGACSTTMNWRFSYQLGSNDFDSIVWAVFSVALDIVKWLILPFSAAAWKHHRLRALAGFCIWFVATVYSFTAALGFAALGRDATIAERTNQAELHKMLQMARQSPRWSATAACTDASTAQSKQFCASYDDIKARATSLPLEIDPQSALLARLTGLGPETARLALSIFLAVACEVVSALGFFALLQPPHQAASSKTAVQTWKPPSWRNHPAKSRHDKADRVMSRPAAT